VTWLSFFEMLKPKSTLRLLLEYAFNLLNLNSVMLGVFAFNLRAITSYRKAGFREIGRRREARIIGRQAHDVVLMDMLAAEFNARYPSRALEGRIAQSGVLKPDGVE
jgi:ribosomal protein S18 acetylase RimI-like enzyme